MLYPHKVPENNPARKGEIAAPKMLFGEHNRYAVAPIHTRFARITWFVWDAETYADAEGRPEVVRQEDTYDQAVAGLM